MSKYETDPKIEDKISAIRKDISELATAVGTVGADLKQTAIAKKDALAKQSSEALDELRSQLSDLERQLAGKVRERPLTALAIALGAGFLLAMMRRR